MKDLTAERTYWQRGIEYLAGVDEAGRGPLAGPVVAAAVIFPKDVFIDGVDDSKKLSEKKREALEVEIRRQAVSIGVGIVEHDVIDRINIYQASILAMRKALDALDIRPQFVAVDGNSFTHDALPYENIIDGDAKVFTIAAASIIAKVTRDKMMLDYHAQYPAYGFAKHKGYGTKQHREAIKEHGLCDIHRRSFHVKLG
ncbi:MAG: ribonuclease HII [Ignavibacteriae bacterium]|nr:ribonuclease HII [Ignavibacteriota bacterium]